MKKLFFLCMLALGSLNTAIAQCAMCRANVESTFSNGRYVNGSGLNTGILYMLSMPYLIAMVVAYLWWRSSKRDRERRLAVSKRVNGALG